MGETRIIIISLQRPKALLRRLVQSLRPGPGKAGLKMRKDGWWLKKKKNSQNKE